MVLGSGIGGVPGEDGQGRKIRGGVEGEGQAKAALRRASVEIVIPAEIDVVGAGIDGRSALKLCKATRGGADGGQSGNRGNHGTGGPIRDGHTG